MTERRRGEFDLIAGVFAPLTDGDPRALSLTDDAAVLPQVEGMETVVTTDTMVAGVHFLENEPPATIARRLLRVNLSDIAAMAAEPVGYFLNLTLSDVIDDRWLDAFGAGLKADQEQFGLNLLGGDTTRTPGPLTLSITLIGEAPLGTAVRRSGARAGDIVMVSGTIGDASLGLAVLRNGRASATGQNGYLTGRFQLPTPRLSLGVGLRGIATAMADVSDGLVSDIEHICAASALAARIDAASIPLSDAARKKIGSGEATLEEILTGGDDYELVLTAAPGEETDVRAAAARAGVPVSVIGRMETGSPEVTVTGADGAPLRFDRPGYRHF